MRKLRITDYMTFALHRLRLSIFAEFPFILRIRYIVMIGGVYCVYDVIWLILCGKMFPSDKRSDGAIAGQVIANIITG